MDYLPSELIIMFAIKLDLPTIANLCYSSRRFDYIICDNEFFWQSKFIHDYGTEPQWIKNWKLGYRQYGETWCMGLNNRGSLGFANPKVNIPVRLTGFKFKQISAGFFHVLGIDLQGNAWSWAKAFRYAREIIVEVSWD